MFCIRKCDVLFEVCFAVLSVLAVVYPSVGYSQNLYRPPQPPAVTSKTPPRGLVRLSTSGPDRIASTVTTGWEGMYQTSTIRPPDPHGAAGPSGVLQTVNLRIQYWTKTGGSIWGPVNFSTFWSGVGNTGTGLADPRVVYDRGSSRFYVILQENLSSQSFLNLAVSKNSNPASSGTNDWHFYRLDMTEDAGGTKYGSDYPGLGVDSQAVYVTYNMYSLPLGGSSSLKNSQIVVLKKADINVGTGTYYQVFTPDGYTNGFTLQPATVLGGTSPGNVAYFGETPLDSSTSVRVWALSDPLGARTLQSTSVTVPNNGGYINGAPQAGTSTTVPTLSPRTQGNAFWYGGALWFCHTAGGSSGKSIVYYYKVNTNSYPSGTPTLSTSGGLDGGSGVWTYQPSIGANGVGDVCIVYTQSSASTYPTIYSTASSGGGSFESATLLKASPGYSNSDRWGDYATVSADPTDDIFYVSHEWAKTTGPHDWSTWWSGVSVVPQPALSIQSKAIDDSAGNNNGAVDPGETISMSIVLANNGSLAATGINATLSTSTPGVTVTQANSAYPNIAVSGTGTNSTAYQFSVSSSVTCGTVIDFTLAVTTNEKNFSLPLQVRVGATTTTQVFFDDMESGGANWTHSAGSGTDTWAIVTDANAKSPARSWHSDDLASVSDQRLVTKSISIPAGDDQRLRFWHTFSFEDGPENYDGGVLEISTTGGSSYEDLGSQILSGGYNGSISTSFDNPLRGRSAWTGGSVGAMTEVVVDLSAYAGQNVLIRWRTGTDSSFSDIGWYVDDVKVTSDQTSCNPYNPPTVEFTSANQNSADESGTMTVTAQLSEATSQDVTIPFTVTGTATNNTDYTVTPSPITIPAGGTTGTITISITSDTMDEPNETVILTMGNPTNAIKGATDVHTATITDDDAAPTVEFTSAAQSSVNESGTLLVTAQLSAVSGRDVEVPFTLSGTATKDTDYTITPTPITIPAGQTTGAATITITNDTSDEPDETVIVTMGNPTNATKGATDVHTATITDDDAAPAVSFTSASQSSAGESGTMIVTAQLSTASGRDVTVPFTVSGTATGGGTDYSITASPIVIPAGQMTGTITITITSDTLYELSETVIVTMGIPINATAGAVTEHTATIVDDDGPAVDFTAASQTVNESVGSITVTAQLAGVSGFDITVPYTLSGTATNGADYTITPSPITIPAGQTTGTITINVINDALDEDDEKVLVTMGNPTNAVKGATTVHTATILDDDPTPTVQFTSAGQSSGTESGAMTVTAQLSAVAGRTVTVPFVVSGTATGGGTDYTITASPITIPAGLTTGTATISIQSDTMDEPDETVILTMGVPINALTGATTVHTATINDDDGAPTVQFTSASQASGGESGTMMVTAQLSEISGFDVTVPFTLSGTATKNTDYTITPSPIVIPAGLISGTATITIQNDALDEPNETVILTMGTPTNATKGGTAVHTATITDDDGPVSVQFTSASQSSLAESGTMTVTAQLSTVSGWDVTVPFTLSGTATKDVDYTITDSPIVIPAGQSTATATITIQSDTTDEANETAILTMDAPTNATAGATTVHTATIVDDDLPPSVQFTSASQASAGESGTMIVTAQLSAVSGLNVTVPFSVTGTATGAGKDYTITASPIVIPAGTMSRTATISIMSDTIDEPDETVILTMGPPTNATTGLINVHTATITDDDAPPSVQFTAASQASTLENGTMTVSAKLSTLSGKTVTVPFTVTGTATGDGTDYSITPSPITIPPGQIIGTITITITDDPMEEPDESVIVTMDIPTNATLGATIVHTATITDDDAVPSVSFTAATQEKNESDGTIAITAQLSTVSAMDVTLPFAVSGTATGGGTDYTITVSPITIPAGQMTGTITVVLTDDALDEEDETVIATMGNPVNATIGAITEHTATILDDDLPPSVSIDDVTVDPEGNSGTKDIVFTVNLSSVSAKTVTVDYATADGTAKKIKDYVTAAGTLTFDPGTTSQTVTVTTLTDLLDEDDETFFVNLSNATNATVTDGQGTGTIVDDDVEPTLTINNVTLVEGNSGTKKTMFTASLSGPSGRTITVDYATEDGTAKAGEDYLTASGTLVFLAGVTTRPVYVTTQTDVLDEDDETFFVNLSNPVHVTVTDSQGQGTIVDDDLPPRMTINDVTVNPEGDAGTKSAVFTVSLSSPSAKTITIDYATASGTATAGSDYDSTGGTLTYSPGDTSKSVTVTTQTDVVDENDETFFVNLSNPANVTVADGQGKGTIVDDDLAATITMAISDATVNPEGDKGTKEAVFTVSLSAPSGKPITVAYATSDGSATAGSDYGSTSGTLTFAPGVVAKSITVTTYTDPLDENDETFFVNLSNPTDATLADSQGKGTIVDDDLPPDMRINDVTVDPEGDAGTKSAVFTVGLSAPSAKIITVNYATADGSATAGSDYHAVSGTLTFAPGDTSKSVTVTTQTDLLVENDETFFVNLSNPTNVTISDNQGQGTIVDDDVQLPSVNVTIDDVTVNPEGNSGTRNAVFTVSLSGPSVQTISVDYATADGSAASGSDYNSISGTLTFAPGDISKSVTVTTQTDLLDEDDETFFVNLSNPTNAVVTDAQGQAAIIDDDAPPSLEINDVSVIEGDSGTKRPMFTVSLSGPSGKTVMVDYATEDGTAGGDDYLTATGTLTFTPGTTAKSVWVTTQADTLDEDDETFFVNLGNPVNALVTDGQGQGTIVDDDKPPAMTINDVTVQEGNGEPVNAVFTVALSTASGRTVTIDYATANGTATAGSDYSAQSGTLTLSPGDLSKTVSVPLVGDTVHEETEIFSVNLSNPTNVTVADGEGRATIIDDDLPPSIALSLNDVIVDPEGNSGTKSAVFTVSLSGAAAKTITVDYATADGSATAGSDYGSTSGTLTFSPGQVSKSVTVTTKTDLLDEEDETFFLNLSNATNVAVEDSQGKGTIVDDDLPPSLTINDVTVTEGNSGTKRPMFTVSLSGPSAKTITVDYTSEDGTAKSGDDYLTAGGALTFPPGTTTRPVYVTTLTDVLDEEDETFFINLSNPTNVTLADGQGKGTIVDDDLPPSLSINDVTVNPEGDTGTKSAIFTVILSAPSARNLSVNYATADGTAKAVEDYSSAAGSLTFAPGVTVKSVTVTTKTDLLDEDDETFFVNLSNPTNVTLADGQGKGIIVDDDTQPMLTINDVTVTEGNAGTVNALFSVSLSTVSGRPVTVNYATANGTALAGSDFVTQTGKLTFNPGDLSKPVSVPVVGETLYETDETFFVMLTSPFNATVADGQGQGTIVNDDPLPQGPDMLIRNSADTLYLGDGVYNADGVNQTSSQPVVRGTVAAALYHFKLQNDGNVTDSYKVKGTKGPAGWIVTYYNALRGGTNITAQVTGTGWLTGNLLPGGYREFRVEVKAGSLVTSGAVLDVLVTATSNSIGSLKDTVKATTTATTGGASQTGRVSRRSAAGAYDGNSPVVLDLSPRVAWLQSPPDKLAAGMNYEVAWQIHGGGTVSHTYIVMSTDPEPTKKPLAMTDLQSGKPGTFKAWVPAPSKGHLYYQAVAIVDGKMIESEVVYAAVK